MRKTEKAEKRKEREEERKQHRGTNEQKFRIQLYTKPEKYARKTKISGQLTETIHTRQTIIF